MAARPGFRFGVCVAAFTLVAGLTAAHAHQPVGGSAAFMPVPRLVWFSGGFQPPIANPSHRPRR